MTEDEKVLAILARVGLTPEQAKRCLEEAKKKLEAVALIGVAGFWS